MSTDGQSDKPKNTKKSKKNKKNNQKPEVNGMEQPSQPSTSELPSNVPKQPMSGPQLAAIEKFMKKFMIDEKRAQGFKFWSTQPVPTIDEKIPESVNEFIEEDKSLDDIKKEPYNLPDLYKWDTLDLNDEDVLQNLYVLLNENYVEDDDNMFRFDYSKEFFRWALMPYGYKKEWHAGVRVSKNNKLVGFISAVPAKMRVYDKEIDMVEINFLCVHKKLRSQRLTPVLIKEITRRVNLTGIFQAVYTAGVVLPKPVASCRYWHRSLNPKKLIDVKFSHLGKNMTMQRTLKLYKLPEQPLTKGFRKAEPSDLPQCHELLNNYLKSFDLSPCFSIEEFKHWFTPKENIIDCYVVETGGKITDFVSYYTLPSTVMHHPSYKSLKAAYSFYNVSTSTPWITLIKDALIAAKKDNFDVFNALDLMENKVFLEELKFGPGDGNLQYYLYNWKCSSMNPEKVGLVLQ